MTTRARPAAERGPVPPPHGPIPAGAPMGPWVRRLADDAEARALASGLRLQILRLTLRESLTNKEIAERLDRNPASVLHHVRTLLATGFLVPDGERRGQRGARELPYRATGKSWYMITEVSGRPILDAFLAEVAHVPAAELETSRLGLTLNAEHRRELGQRLDDVLREFADRPSDPDGEPWSVFLALHPERRRARLDRAANPPGTTSPAAGGARRRTSSEAASVCAATHV